MSRESLVLAEAVRCPWAIEPRQGSIVMNVLMRHSRGEAATALELEEAKATREARSGRRSAGGTYRGAIAVLPLTGTILPKAGLLTEYSGGTSCQLFASQLREAVSDETIDQILIDIDSPGGSVHGVQELASEIMQLRTQKPIVGIANHQAASAAYWLGACCTELYVSPSGEVGSIGVYTMHQDVSEAMAKEGVKNTFISAGKYKTEGSPYSPLDPEARDHIQSQVNEYYRAFVAAVARGRGVSIDKAKSDFGQGRMLTADAAKKAGMADGVTDINSLIRDMQSTPRNVRAGRGAAKAMSFGGPDALARAAAARRREIELLSL